MKIAVFGSHSALQILKGARDEDIETTCICLKGREQPYKSFKIADKIIVVDDYKEYFKIEQQLIKEDAILIPHASMISYLGAEKINSIKARHFGDRKILEIESDRYRQEKWLKDAGLTLPKTFDSPDQIDRLCIVKSHGAAGGSGYFLVKNKADFLKKSKIDDPVIQEYVVGVPVYIHYFYSPLDNELELMGFDKRYESNVDSIGRINAQDKIDANIHPSYSIIGNMPLVLRESLLPEVFKMGEAVVKISKQISKKGLIGPFCLETVVTPDMKFYVFEISARIVAGTNVYPDSTPYTVFRYKEPMSTGRRIAREIKNAIKEDKTELIIG